MKHSGKSNLFALVCIAVLLGAYGVGLGIKQIRLAGAEARAAAESEKSADEPADAVAADTDTEPEPSDEQQEEVSQAEAEGEGEGEPFRRRPEGGRMMGEGMRERFQNMSEEERQEAMARMRERFGGRRGGRGEGGGPFAQLSEEDRESFRADMEALGARAADMSDEEREQARNEILEKYGIEPGRFGGRPGGGRRGGGGGGGGAAPPPKGRACFVPETPVWVDGKLVQIAKVTAGGTIRGRSGGAFALEQVQSHEGTFECRDILLESGNTIAVVDAHCFMLASGQWAAAQNLKSGQRLKTLTGTVRIKSVSKRKLLYTGKVYNLKVKNSDRYLVGRDVIIVRDY